MAINYQTSAKGFTLIELLVVLAIISLLLTIAVPRYFNSLEHAKETALVENLKVLRTTLDRFYEDTGRYPDTLDELVTQHYVRSVPIDPITEVRDSWILIPPENLETGGIYDIKSGAQGQTRDGIPYASL